MPRCNAAECSDDAEYNVRYADKYAPDEGSTIEQLCQEHADELWTALMSDETMTGLFMSPIVVGKMVIIS